MFSKSIDRAIGLFTQQEGGIKQDCLNSKLIHCVLVILKMGQFLQP